MPNYSKAQKEAVCHGAGPMMVLAGPGSGKTFVITHRIKFLIEEKKINPNNILVLTFSKAAAVEMEERFNILCEDKKVSFGTFHSIFFSILKRAYGYSSDQVISEDKKLVIMKEIISKFNFISEDISVLAITILEEISKVKQERLDLDFYYSKSCSSDIFKEIYKLYEGKLGELKKIDFDDMLLMTYDLLSQREDIRQVLEDRYSYILVDEFQDINYMQYEIVKMLAGEKANLTVVGDDDQSIYSFRGAKPELMLNFGKDYPKYKSVILDINYRSTRQIVETSLKLISYNKKRFNKDITANRGEGRNVEVLSFKNPVMEAKTIVSDIRKYVELGFNYDDIAILYRTNIQPRILSEILIENAIPFVMKDNIPNLYEHWIAKDIFAYLRLAYDLGSRADIVRIANKPNRYIKRDVLQQISDIYDLLDEYEDISYMKERMVEFEHCIHTMSQMKPATAIRFIKKGIGYEKYIEEHADYHGIESGELLDILSEIESSADDFNDFKSWLYHIEAYKAELEEKRRLINKDNACGVRLMTFHSSKGLEYKIVYIIEANKDICPYKKAKSSDELEEERRMFYVAMTRARDRLCICTTQNNFHAKTEASEFISEIKRKN